MDSVDQELAEAIAVAAQGPADGGRLHPDSESRAGPGTRKSTSEIGSEGSEKSRADQEVDHQGDQQNDSGEDDQVGDDLDAVDIIPTIHDVRAALGELDSELDEALGKFSENVWNMASTAVAKTSAVASARAPVAAPDPRVIAQTMVKTTTAGSETLRNGLLSIGSRIRAESRSLESAVAKVNETRAKSGPLDATLAHSEEAKSEPRTTSTSALGGNTIGMISGWFGSAATTLTASMSVVPSDSKVEGAREPLSRFQQRVETLKADPDTYLEPANDPVAFRDLCERFSLDAHDDHCKEILDDHPEIMELFERVVPRLVEEDIFWFRYFFKLEVLEAEEKKRQALLQSSTKVEEEEDIRWSDDDDAHGEECGPTDASGQTEATEKSNEQRETEPPAVELPTESLGETQKIARGDDGDGNGNDDSKANSDCPGDRNGDGSGIGEGSDKGNSNSAGEANGDGDTAGDDDADSDDWE